MIETCGRGFPTHRLIALATALGSVAGSMACGETTVSSPLPAARVEIASTTAVQGPAGGRLADPVEVRVVGSDDQPLPGATVTFTATGDGSVDPASATSDDDGIARTHWTLGTTAGSNTLTAAAGEGVSATVTATVTAARAASVDATAGDGQTAPVGSELPTPPTVRVTDGYGNPAAGVAVSFSVLAGGGHVEDGLATTDSQGVASAEWTLGPAPGEHALLVRVEESGVAGNPVVFTATATSETVAEMVATAGDGQQSPVGRLVPVAPTVRVLDTGGDGVPGVVVTFTAASGGGTVVGSRQTTDASGTATVGGWFLGPLPGTNTLSASSPGLQGVTFTATGTAGVAASMAAVSQTSQAAPAGTNVADPPGVIVRDAQGIPVSGVTVTFTVTTGGGSVVGSPAITGQNGVARVTSWRLGNAMGPNTLTATSPGLPSVTFSASGTAGAPANVVATAGTNQAAVQGTNVAVPPTVRVTDAGGHPVVGATVTFAVLQGGGTITGPNQVTDLQGLAAVGSWTLGTGSPNQLRAMVTGSGIAGNPVTFTAHSATQVGVTSAPVGPIALGADFTITAQLRNAVGGAVPLAGVPLTIAIASGGGTLNGTVTRVTDASGAVSFTLINVTGAAGLRTFTVSGTGLTPATTAGINFN